MSDLTKHVETLIAKAAECKNGFGEGGKEAAQFSQAALNAANAMLSLLTYQRETAQGEDPELVERMTQRFLGWKLPKTFNPDGGITFQRVTNEGTAHAYMNEPVGTNLLDYTQAKAMVEHLLAK